MKTIQEELDYGRYHIFKKIHQNQLLLGTRNARFGPRITIRNSDLQIYSVNDKTVGWLIISKVKL